MKYLGDFIAGQAVPVPWNTFGTGAESVTCTGGTLHITTGTGGTETSATSLSGSSADIRNFATRTGSHLFFCGTATLSGPADYQVKLSGATVGAATINPWLGFFSIRNRSNQTILGRALVSATGATNEFQLAATGGMFSTTADVYIDAGVSVVDGGGRGQSGVASAYATTSGARYITVPFSGGVAVTASSSLIEVIGLGVSGLTATEILTTTGVPTNFADMSIDGSGYVTIAGTSPGAINAASFDTGAINGTALATDAASKINQYTAALRGAAAFNDFRFSMTATSGSGFATGQTVSVSLAFGTAARATVAGGVTEISDGEYAVDFTAGELPAGSAGIFRATATGALTREIHIITTPAT